MPRSTLAIIVFIILLLGGCYFLSTQAKQVPTKTIEVPVTQGGNAQ